MAELRSMRNIGREMARKLAAVGIDTPDKLRAAGSAEAFEGVQRPAQREAPVILTKSERFP